MNIPNTLRLELESTFQEIRKNAHLQLFDRLLLECGEKLKSSESEENKIFYRTLFGYLSKNKKRFE